MERTEGCKQLIELVPVTVSCARLLDTSLKSHNSPAKVAFAHYNPPHFQMRKWRLRGLVTSEPVFEPRLELFLPSCAASLGVIWQEMVAELAEARDQLRDDANCGQEKVDWHLTQATRWTERKKRGYRTS